MVVLAMIVLFGLIAMRVPVAFALLLAGGLGLFLLRDGGYTLQTAARVAYQTPGRYVLIVIPLFIAMGIFAKHGTLAEDGFAMARRVLGNVPGGLAMATVVTCAGFAAVSGSSVATVATIGPLAIREMRRYGYSTTLAAGVVGASGTLGVLIPPSIILVLYGIVTGESIGTLLIAGIVPGVVSALVYLVAIYLRGLARPELVGAVAKANRLEREGADRDGRRAGNRLRRERSAHAASETRAADVPIALGRAVSTTVRVGLLFTVVVGGIYFGVVTATEAAGLGATLALGFFIYDTVKGRGKLWPTFKEATLEAVSLTSMSFALLFGAGVLTFFLVAARVPAAVTDWVVGLAVPDFAVVLIVLAAFIPLGMFLDPISMLLIGVPLAYPVVTELGYDGIWFGILVVKLIELGLVTPPFGMNAYVVAGAAEDVTVEETFRGILWFLPADLLTVMILFAFPGLVLWLPSLMSG